MANHGKKWSEDDINYIHELLNEGIELDEIASLAERNPDAILWQIIKYIEKNKVIPSTYDSDIYEKLNKISHYRNIVKKFKLKIPDCEEKSNNSEDSAEDSENYEDSEEDYEEDSESENIHDNECESNKSINNLSINIKNLTLNIYLTK